MSAGPPSSSSQQFRPVDFDPFAPRGTQVVLPLTPAQQEVWMAAQLGADASAAYNQCFPLRLTGQLSIESMRSALAGLTERHEALRVTFSPDGEGQVVRPSVTIPLTLNDLSGVAPGDRSRAIDDLLAREVRDPFDLAEGPLLRVRVVREADDRHLLIVTAHHLICDGWSSGLLLRELGSLYTADCHGLRPRLAEPMSYSVYVRGASAESDERTASERYWLDQFSAGVPTLELPSDRARTLTRTFRGTHERATVDAGLYQELKRLGARHGCSLYVTLLAAWQVLLFRLTHNLDFVVGIPVSEQTALDNQNLAAHAVHVLPLRTSIDPSASFADQLVRTRRTLGEAHEHRAISFGQLGPFKQSGDSTQGPALATVFNVDPPVDPPRFYGLQVERMVAPRSSFGFEIGLDIADTGSTLQIECNYNTDLFDGASIRRWLDCYLTLLASAAGDAGNLSRLTILSADQRAALCRQGIARATFEPRPIVQEFEAVAARSPEAVAVSFQGDATTYDELNRRANRIAHRLRELGVTRDTRVGICLERSVDLVAAIVGVLKAGGAYVPFEPNSPAERVRSMVEQADARAVITTAAGLHHFASLNVPIVCLDRDAGEVARAIDTNPSLASNPADLAYVIFTSGSTGQPKGVAVTHENLARLFQSTEHWFDFGPSDVWTLFHSCSFDFSVWELWGALRYGGRLVVVPSAISRSPDAFLELIEREGVSVLNQTPSAFRQLIEAGRTAQVPLSRLRLVIFGGEALDLPSLRLWTDRRGDAMPVLVNMYGITETTVHVTYRPLKAGDLTGARSRIGVPLPDLDLHLLDPSSLELVPDGTIGEICVGGAGVARGYLNRPDLSASRFVPNGFGEPGRGTLYRSGDLARRRNDGDLEYLGRADDQVKVRGFRIELGEIEAWLVKHPGVRESVVVARDNGPGDKQLVAYLIPDRSEAPPPADELRAFLKTQLPDYMIPAAFVALEAFPLTQNGKIDRRRLPDPAPYRRDRSVHVAPRTPTEQIVADQWRKVLRVDDVGVFDNFFEIGGHSLLAIQLILRLEEALGIRLPVLRLFEAPTVAGIASNLLTAGGAHVEAASPGIARRPADGPAPLSFGQQRLWFLDEFEPGASSYNIANAIELRGPLDVESLGRAIGTIVSRHESLRTTFELVDGRPVQVIGAPPAGWPLPLINLRGLSKDARSAELRRIISDEAHRPFDLRRGPMFRSILIQLAEDEHVLVLAVHHIAYDGWSHGIFCRELSQLYGAYCSGGLCTLPLPPIQYADYALWQREHLRGDVLDEQIAYWRRTLSGPLPVLTLPTDRARPAMQTWRGALERFRLEPALVESLRSLGRSENATLFMTLLALFQAFLHRYAGQEDIVVGTPVAGRTRAETEDMIGFCVNTLAVRTDFASEPTVRALVARVRDAVIEAVAHQDVPFEKLVEELHVERSLSHSPVFQAVFSLDETSEPPSLPGLASSLVDVETGIAKFDLTWWATDRPDGLSCIFEYNTDLFDAETAARFADHFQRLVAAAVARPDASVADLPLLGEGERSRIRAQGNAAAPDLGPAVCVHELVEAHAARTPDAPALVCEGQTLTYAELNARANRIASLLRQRGVGPESLVGICLERSLEMVVCVLGVLKAGGAYLPLDPSYPADRLAFMLDDAQPSVLLTLEALLPRLRSDGDRIVCIDRDAAMLERQPACNPDVSVPTEALAYVIYTSGSTGRPKGVAVTHANVSRLMDATRAWFDFGSTDVWTLFHSYAFDFSVWEMWGALTYGGRLVIVPHWISRSPDGFRELLVREHVTVLNQTPSAFRQLIQEESQAPRRLTALRYVILGGEALELQSLGPWFQRYGDEHPRVVNMYGITETTVHVTYRPIRQADVTERSGSVIGVPIPDLQVHLLDGRGRLVPFGVPGEIYVGGAGVARGYLNRPELTSARFLEHRFEDGTTARLYRSGDLARRMPSGEMEYLGRADDQVKIRGFRIELSEIEGVLRGHPAVRDCAVVVRETNGADRRLVAYVVIHGDGDAPVESLREHARAQLPDYMVPPAFVRLDVLPLSPNGKVDRRALPSPDESAYASSAVPVAPRTPVEQTIAGIWAKALGRHHVSVHDNFFEAGGHSLLAAEVVAGLRKAFDVEIPLVALFKAPTVAELAQAVEAIRWAAANASVSVADGIREEIEL